MEEFSFRCYIRPTRYIPLVKVSDAHSRGKHLITHRRLKSYVWEYDAFIDHSRCDLIHTVVFSLCLHIILYIKAGFIEESSDFSK